MLHAILIVTPDQNQALTLAKQLSRSDLSPHPDILIVEDQPSIGIQKIKTLEKFLSQKPYQKEQKIIFIPQADQLTLPAQNALLKTLEDPPAHSLIILVSPHQNHLLPTIISRCEIHRFPSPSNLNNQFLTAQASIFNQLQELSLGQKINFISQYSVSKSVALDFCTNQLKFLRYRLIFKNQPACLPIVKSLAQALNRLNQNLNPKLILENLIFHYPRSEKTAKI